MPIHEESEKDEDDFSVYYRDWQTMLDSFTDFCCESWNKISIAPAPDEPDDPEEEDNEEEPEPTDSGVDQSRSEWVFEPEAEELLGRLIPEYVTISIYRALLESSASELGARMTAMRNAAENAESINDELTLEMNRARQAEITQQILEVVGGAEALS